MSERIPEETAQRITQEIAPCLMWAVTLGRRLSDKEFDMFLDLLDERSRVKAGKFADRGEATRYVLLKLLPRLLLYNEHPAIHPSHWTYTTGADGKQFVESKAYTPKILGYDIDYQNSLVAMNYCWGTKEEVRHVGVAVENLLPALPDIKTGQALLQAHLHELSANEKLEFNEEMEDSVIIRRLCILRTLKRAYARAIGQTGFNYSTVDCRIPEQTIFVRGERLTGWEFRLTLIKMGVHKTSGMSTEETYQCACAVYRGGEPTVFLFDDNLDPQKPGKKWLYFIALDAIVSNLPKGPRGGPPNLAPGSDSNPQPPPGATRRVINRKRIQRAMSSNSSSAHAMPPPAQSPAPGPGSGSKS